MSIRLERRTALLVSPPSAERVRVEAELLSGGWDVRVAGGLDQLEPGWRALDVALVDAGVLNDINAIAGQSGPPVIAIGTQWVASMGLRSDATGSELRVRAAEAVALDRRSGHGGRFIVSATDLSVPALVVWTQARRWDARVEIDSSRVRATITIRDGRVLGAELTYGDPNAPLLVDGERALVSLVGVRRGLLMVEQVQPGTAALPAHQPALPEGLLPAAVARLGAGWRRFNGHADLDTVLVLPPGAATTLSPWLAAAFTRGTTPRDATASADIIDAADLDAIVGLIESGRLTRAASLPAPEAMRTNALPPAAGPAAPVGKSDAAQTAVVRGTVDLKQSRTSAPGPSPVTAATVTARLRRHRLVLIAIFLLTAVAAAVALALTHDTSGKIQVQPLEKQEPR